MSEHTKLHHGALNSYYFEDTIRLYQEGLGLTIGHIWGRGNRVYMMDLGDGAYIEVMEGGPETVKDQGRWPHIGLKTDDIWASYNRAIAAGAKPKAEPMFCDVIEGKPEPVQFWAAAVIGFEGEDITFIQEVPINGN